MPEPPAPTPRIVADWASDSVDAAEADCYAHSGADAESEGERARSDPWEGTVLEGTVVKDHPNRPGWTWNDFGMGMRMADLYHHVLRSVGKTWRLYEEGCWIADQGGDHDAVAFGKEAVRRLIPRELKFYNEKPTGKKGEGPSELDLFIDWAKGRQTAQRLAAGMRCAASEPLLRAGSADFDKHPELINLASGVLNIKTWETAAHHYKYLMTRKTRASWNPGAVCAVWDMLLTYQFPDPKERNFVETALAYAALIDGNPRKLLLMLIGPKDSGKSRVTEILLYIMGTYAKSFEMSLLRGKHGSGPRPDIVQRMDCRLVTASEANDTGELHADFIKKLSGGDTLSGRNLYESVEKEKAPSFTAVMALNNAPSVKGADAALLRRLLVLPFSKSVPLGEQMLDMATRLEAEVDGIFYRLADCLRRNEGMLDSIPERFRHASLAAFEAMNSLYDFVQHCSVPDSGGLMSSSEIGKLYQVWTHNMHFRDQDKLNNIQLGMELSKLGWDAAPKVVWHEGKPQRVRTGRRLKSVAEGADQWLAYRDAGLGDI